MQTLIWWQTRQVSEGDLQSAEAPRPASSITVRKTQPAPPGVQTAVKPTTLPDQPRPPVSARHPPIYSRFDALKIGLSSLYISTTPSFRPSHSITLPPWANSVSGKAAATTTTTLAVDSPYSAPGPSPSLPLLPHQIHTQPKIPMHKQQCPQTLTQRRR